MACIAGWQWEPADRPTFREIHIALDNMIHTSSVVGEGIQLCRSYTMLHILS